MRKLILFIIIAFAIFIRTLGLNWDQNQHLHPDERFITMVADKLSWPTSVSEYFSTGISPLNPHNQKFDFYVYGTYPVILVKAISSVLHLDDYVNLVLVGRFVSAVFDTLVIIVVYFISREVFPNSRRAALWAAGIYSISVLPIQLSHFFATDPYLVLFITLSFYVFCLFYKSSISWKLYVYAAFLGLCFGLAIGAKISGVIFAPTLAFGFLIILFKTKKIFPVLLCGLIFALFSFISLRVSQPYLFSSPSFFTISLNAKVLNNWQQLTYESQPNHYYPPSTQWVTLKKGLFPFINLALFGLGLPIFLIVFISLFYSSFVYRKNWLVLLLAFSIIFIFVYQSFQFAQPMRYFYPIYPFMAVLAGGLLSRFHLIPSIVVGLVCLIWPASFLSIYLHPNSRVAASVWMDEHLPAGSKISCDYWDDCLPVSLPKQHPSFDILQIEPYAKESPEKWATFFANLSQVDYLVISSNRLYASITSDPSYYPQTSTFYKYLFSGELGFQKVAEFTSRPYLALPFINYCLTPPFATYGQIAKPTQDCKDRGLTINDDYSDETFTVYDHPKVIIFKKTAVIDYAKTLGISF